MKIVQLSFPGRFEDAFLYMGRLIVITENHSVRIYDMESVVNKLEENKVLLDAPTFLFFRNDWIKSQGFRDRLDNETGKESFLKAVKQLESEQIKITTDFVKPVEWDLKIAADILLDLNIYNGRLYIGTNTGLYHLDLDWEEKTTKPINTAQKRLDAKCIHTTAKYGTVNASCGSDGWFSFLDVFDLGMSNSPKEKHNSEYSLRTAWLDFDLVNYPTTVTPTLFNSVKTRLPQQLIESKKNVEQEQWIITELEDNKFELNSLFVNLNSTDEIDIEDLQFVHNSAKILFLSTYNRQLFALKLKTSSLNNPTVSYVTKYDGLNSLVSSLHTLSGGNSPALVLETDEQVILFAHNTFTPVFDGEVISIRTFSGSKHYRNIISLTTSNEVLLIAIFDE
jgi:hypothetical protein